MSTIIGPVPQAPTARVFVIGAHKTATTSVEAACIKLGYISSGFMNCPHSQNPDPFPDDVIAHVNSYGHSGGHHVFKDSPYNHGDLYKALDQRLQGCTFVLTVRDDAQWLQSYRRFWKHTGGLQPMIYELYGPVAEAGRESEVKYPSARNEQVIDYFTSSASGNNTLLVMPVESLDMATLAKACGRGSAVAAKDLSFPKVNVTQEGAAGPYRFPTFDKVMELARPQCWAGFAPADKCQDMFDAIRAAAAEFPEDTVLKCAEIGVLEGSCLVVLARIVAGRGHAVGIDPMVPYFQNTLSLEGNDRVKTIDFNGMPRRVRALLRSAGVSDCAELWQQSSADPEVERKLEAGGGLHVLHVDGNHDYEYVVEDLRLAKRVVVPGGVLIVDDTPWASVTRAMVEELGPDPSFAMLKAGRSWQVWRRASKPQPGPR